MTFGEKLSKLRKEHNYTQEQLADILGVTRQSISKWESDIAYPETEKLIKMGKLFECSMDYLLNDDATEKTSAAAGSEELWVKLKKCFRERKSEKTVLGMPLYHIGRDAHGFFAVGLKASGVFAIGLLSRGAFSLGFLSLGVLSVGLLSLGIIALGTFACGLLAAGAI
ncbi:MAG: helix-turn-helix transcriptional regulator, partial [Clostridia bacterium]|nr:helix-turn-helix transcriptional regulator [Clostridia bacterium]